MFWLSGADPVTVNIHGGTSTILHDVSTQVRVSAQHKDTTINNKKTVLLPFFIVVVLVFIFAQERENQVRLIYE